MPKHLNKVQREVLRNVIHAIEDHRYSSIDGVREYLADRSMEWLLDWPIWSAGENMPGYMPETPYALCITEREAKGYCNALRREAGGNDYAQDYRPTTLREALS